MSFFPTYVTDHMTIFIKFPIVWFKVGEYFIRSFRINGNDFLDVFERCLSSYVDAFDVGNDINNDVYLLLEKFYDMYSCFPIRLKNASIHRYLKSWISDSLVEYINQQYRIFPR